METKNLKQLIDEAFEDRYEKLNNTPLPDHGEQLTRSFCKYLELTLDDMHVDPDIFELSVSEFLQSVNKDKYIYAIRFDYLIHYLNKEYNLKLSTEFLSKFKFPDSDRRKLEILKYLHEEGIGKTREDLAEHFGVSAKVISKDLGELTEGFSFLETNIKINGHDKKNTIYNSPVHPVFLALNTTQIYALEIALKLLSKQSIFHKILTEIGDSVYDQLSCFAKEKINLALSEMNICFSDVERRFISTTELIVSDNLNKLAQCIRKSGVCEIVLKSEMPSEGNTRDNSLKGTPKLYIDDNLLLDRVELVLPDGESVIIHKDSIEEIYYPQYDDSESILKGF